MKFSIISEKNQLEQNAASVWVSIKGEKHTPAVAANLLSALQNGLDVEADVDSACGLDVNAGQLNAVAVLQVAARASRAKLEKHALKIAQYVVEQKAQAVSIDVRAADATTQVLLVDVLVLAFSQAVYRFDEHKRDAKAVSLAEVQFVGSNDLQAALNKAQVLAKAVAFAKDLGNQAPNICTPTYLAEQAKKHAEAAGATAKLHDAAAIQAMGMGSFWAVAKGSIEAPYLIELTYNGAADANEQPYVLVGKGITFDTGGISLKPGPGMDEMKYDMFGAASVIASFCAAAEMKLPINLKAIVPTCENMPSGGAAKPGDIVKAMNGISIEILNTDAEGRLILCDALAFAEQFKPQAVVDVATLTGACIIALGHEVSGVMGNNQDLVNQLLAVGTEVNDCVWQLPLFDDYRDLLKSNFADLANIGGRPAGTITAAAFLSYFTENYAWAHLDVAGTAWASGASKGATGRPVPLLVNYLCQQAAK